MVAAWELLNRIERIDFKESNEFEMNKFAKNFTSLSFQAVYLSGSSENTTAFIKDIYANESIFFLKNYTFAGISDPFSGGGSDTAYFPVLIRPVWVPINILQRSNLNRLSLSSINAQQRIPNFQKHPNYDSDYAKAISTLDAKIKAENEAPESLSKVGNTNIKCSDQVSPDTIKTLFKEIEYYLKNKKYRTKDIYKVSSPANISHLKNKKKSLCPYFTADLFPDRKATKSADLEVDRVVSDIKFNAAGNSFSTLCNDPNDTSDQYNLVKPSNANALIFKPVLAIKETKSHIKHNLTAKYLQIGNHTGVLVDVDKDGIYAINLFSLVR